MTKTYFNIHGFGSNGENSKAEALKNKYPNNKIISPDFPVYPDECLEIIEQKLAENSNDDIILQGSSMGGLYSLITNIRHNIPALLINPALNPADLIKSKIGEEYEMSSGETIIIDETHANPFENPQNEISQAQQNGHKIQNVLALLGEDDELLDQELMSKILTDLGVKILWFKTDHHFEGFDKAIVDNEIISDFLNNGKI